MSKDQRFDNSIKYFSAFIVDPLKEVYIGFDKKVIPWFEIAITCGLVNLALALGLLQKFALSKGLGLLLPKTFLAHAFLVAGQWLLILYLWGMVRFFLRKRLTTRLTELFLTANLKTATGKLPALVFDQPIDDWTRKLRLKKMNLPKESFISAKPFIESGLQIFIDEIRENRESGTLDVIYSHHEMPRSVELENFINAKDGEFTLGKTRSRFVTSSFSEVPHLLIGGQTGGGKSTFLRQMITSLYLSNASYTFYLIDLKGGLEFQLFENLPRIQVLPSAKQALETLKTLEVTLEHRFKILKLNNTKDLSAFHKIPEKERKYPNDVPAFFRNVNRTITVIDEAAELFMAGDLNKSSDVQEARKLTAKIAAQGRAVGVHLIIATQKPDVKAIDSHIKTNLTGIISFQMPNLGSSMSILSSGRAADLPSIAGRAIWKSGLDQLEIQTPFVSVAEVEKALRPIRQTHETANEEWPTL